jgi:hypothetical protein
MAALINMNPMLTTSPLADGFLVETQGYIQGFDFDDQIARMHLKQGVVSASATAPVYAGMLVTEEINTINQNGPGNIIIPATAMGTGNVNYSGFTVLRQANNMIIATGNSVPLAGSGMSCMYFQAGSGARIMVAVDSSLASSLEGGSTTQQVSWDFTNQALTAYDSTTGALPVKIISFNDNSQTVLVNSGIYSWNPGQMAAIIQI